MTKYYLQCFIPGEWKTLDAAFDRGFTHTLIHARNVKAEYAESYPQYSWRLLEVQTSVIE